MTAATPAGPNAYHWIVTVKYGDDTLSNLNGVLTISPGATRADVYAWVREQISATIKTDNFALLYFDLAPNSLDGGAR